MLRGLASAVEWPYGPSSWQQLEFTVCAHSQSTSSGIFSSKSISVMFFKTTPQSKTEHGVWEQLNNAFRRQNLTLAGYFVY